MTGGGKNTSAPAPQGGAQPTTVPIGSGLASVVNGQDPNHDQTAANAALYRREGAPNAGRYLSEVPTLNRLGAGAESWSNGALNHQMDYSGADAGTAAQNDAMGLSGQLARGQGPSLSRANMNLGLSQGINNMASLSAGMGTRQGGLGQRNLMNAAAGMQGNAAGQGAIAGAAEQIGNIQNYGALGSAARAQGLQQAGLSAQNAHTNTTEQMRGLGLAADLSGQRAGLSIGYDRDLQGFHRNAFNASQGVIENDRESNGKWVDRLFNGIGSTAKAVVAGGGK